MKKPKIRLYRGYANEQELIVMGHVFKPNKKVEYDFRKRKLKNAKSVINTFRIKTANNFDVFLRWNNEIIHTKTRHDGYFAFHIPLKKYDQFGWISYEVYIEFNEQIIVQNGSFMRPSSGNLGFISDIDDTFLVSHTKNPLKKLYILLFKNVLDRKVFEGVVPHYEALSKSNSNNNENIFFYVSSSEWNLYRFIVDFTELHKLPKAILLLKDIKTNLTDFFMSGRGNHNHKFEKIKHILEFYPNLQYTLLGDDSQEDAALYERICKIFPVTIKAIYIRQTGKNKKQEVIKILQNIETLNIKTCYFKKSAQAIEHSKEIGLI